MNLLCEDHRCHHAVGSAVYLETMPEGGEDAADLDESVLPPIQDRRDADGGIADVVLRSLSGDTLDIEFDRAVVTLGDDGVVERESLAETRDPLLPGKAIATEVDRASPPRLVAVIVAGKLRQPVLSVPDQRRDVGVSEIEHVRLRNMSIQNGQLLGAEAVQEHPLFGVITLSLAGIVPLSLENLGGELTGSQRHLALEKEVQGVDDGGSTVDPLPHRLKSFRSEVVEVAETVQDRVADVGRETVEPLHEVIELESA